MVRVQVWVDTEENPVHRDAEIWFRGHGSWWLKTAVESGSDAKNIGRRKVGEKDNLVFYPEGRDGREINIPIVMTSEMNPSGSARDSIILTIQDNEIEVLGLPIEAATGEVSMKIERN